MLFLVGVSGGGAYPRRIYSYVLWTYLTKLTFRGAYQRGGGGYDGFLRYVKIMNCMAMINYKPTICCPQISVTYPRNPAKFSIVLLVWVEKTEGVHPPFRDCNTSILAIVAVPHRGRSDRVSGFQVPL